MHVRAGKIGWTRHAEERMEQRGYDKSQVKECLMKGTIIESPTIPIGSKTIEYVFTIKSRVDFEDIRVVAKLIPARMTVVITVIDPS